MFASINKKYLIGFLVISLITAFLIYYQVTSETEGTAYLTLSWFLATSLNLWVVNWLLAKVFNYLLPWLKFGVIRFFIHLLIGIAFSLLVINGAYFLFKELLTDQPPVTEQIVVMNVYGATVFIPFFSIYFGLHFLRHWRKSAVDVEKFRKEHLHSQLESLKNHLDPHFLFNNLNILSSLIDKDQELSKAFLNKFAEVYRSILRSKDEDLITVEEELDFIDSYIYLIHTRFESNIRFEIAVDPAIRPLMIPPLGLQMLMENAIKHNIITEKEPLVIKVTNQGKKYLIVSNTYKPKEGSNVNRKGSGLRNIVMRYQYFTEEQVKVDKEGTHFTVSLPLLEIESV